MLPYWPVPPHRRAIAPNLDAYLALAPFPGRPGGSATAPSTSSHRLAWHLAGVPRREVDAVQLGTAQSRWSYGFASGTRPSHPGGGNTHNAHHRRPRYAASATYRPERRAARSSDSSRAIVSARSCAVTRGFRSIGADHEDHRLPGSTASRRAPAACGSPLMGGLLWVGFAVTGGRLASPLCHVRVTTHAHPSTIHVCHLT